MKNVQMIFFIFCEIFTPFSFQISLEKFLSKHILFDLETFNQVLYYNSELYSCSHEAVKQSSILAYSQSKQ